MKRRLGSIHDVIFFYVNGESATWNPQYGEYSPDYIEQFFRHHDEDGRRYRIQNVTNPNSNRPNLKYDWNGHVRVWKWTRERSAELEREGRIQFSSTGFPGLKQYLDKSKGPVLQDIWTDIPSLQGRTAERLGFPTQKPIALLERILQCSSNERDVVLDPFCGCGTTVAAAEALGRRWIGIDITHLAINLIRHRLRSAHGTAVESTFEVIGEPASLAGAAELAASDPYQFQWWALGLVGASPREQKKGADKGIDGRLFFHDKPGGKTKQAILSVKAGKTGVAHVRDLVGVLLREEAQIGVLISLREPTKPMRVEAASAGFYDSSWGKHPRVQLLTIEDLLAGKGIDYPSITGSNVTFKRARRQQKKVAEQLHLVDSPSVSK